MLGLEVKGLSRVEGAEKMTGLPEYRNGGLFIDYKVLTPKKEVEGKQDVHDELIIEWRALTIVLLD